MPRKKQDKTESKVDEILDDVAPEPKVEEEKKVEEEFKPKVADGVTVIEVNPSGGKAEVMKRKLTSLCTRH